MTPTTLHTYRADDAEYATWLAKAAEQGTTLSDVIRTLLRDWVEEK